MSWKAFKLLLSLLTPLKPLQPHARENQYCTPSVSPTPFFTPSVTPVSLLSDCSNPQSRESRYFKTWKRLRYVEDHMLMTAIADITGQRSVPFGDGALIFR